MEGPAFGFRLSFPVEGEALGAAHCFFDTKAFCDNIRYNEDVVMCILSTYSIQLSHTLAQCGSVMGGHVLILHGSQSLREDEDASWIKYKKDRSHSGTVLVRYVGPTKTKYCAGRSLRAPALQSYDVVASQGVHHPKYMLVFTRTRLHVAITTSNLVSDRSLNATWSQTFARVGAAVAAPAGFGAVLEDFLRQQCLQAGAPVDGAGDDLFAWVLGAALVDRLATSFNFSEAEVDLVAVVPGRYRVHRSSVGGREHVSLSRGWTAADGSPLRRHRCSHCAGKDINPSAASVCVPGMPGLEFCYGAFRVRELLQLLEKELWRPLSHQDIFIAQPTSIGSGIRNDFVATLLHSYMPDPDWDDRAEQLRQDSWYLIWPTADYMQCGISDEVGESNHMLFISAEVLALMEPDILAQLRTYEPLAVGGTNAVLAFPPHIKSYARVYRSIATEHISDSTQSACLCPSVAWFLLTSACLSKGAQGVYDVDYMQCCGCGEKTTVEIVEYRNFELGVFFHASKERGTEYLAIRPDCPVHGGYCRGEGNDLNFARSRNCSDRKCVMLPVPYDLCGGEKYYSADSAVFHYSPYLNKADELNRFGLRGALPAPISEKHKKLSFKFEADCEPHASLKRMKSDSPGESCAVSLQSSEGHVCCDNDVASESTSAIGAGSILSSRAVTNVSNFVEDYLCDF